MINRHYMQTIIASSASLPLRAEARLVAPVPLRALVHNMAVGVFSRLPPAAPLWSDRLGISATCSRGRARGRRDLPCSQRDPTRSESRSPCGRAGGKNSIFGPHIHTDITTYSGLASFLALDSGSGPGSSWVMSMRDELDRLRRPVIPTDIVTHADPGSLGTYL